MIFQNAIRPRSSIRSRPRKRKRHGKRRRMPKQKRRQKQQQPQQGSPVTSILILGMRTHLQTIQTAKKLLPYKTTHHRPSRQKKMRPNPTRRIVQLRTDLLKNRAIHHPKRSSPSLKNKPPPRNLLLRSSPLLKSLHLNLLLRRNPPRQRKRPKTTLQKKR
jgi:hypothetical protein